MTIIDLHNLKPNPGAHKHRKIIGRGNASGHGKTAGRGQKGQRARSGGRVRIGFEGGQTPIYRRLPKIGVGNDLQKTKYVVFNVGRLNSFGLPVVSPQTLYQAKKIKKRSLFVKILGNGELTKKLEVHAHKISKQAQVKIKQAQGHCVILTDSQPSVR